MKRLFRIAIAGLMASGAAFAQAPSAGPGQSYPSKPIRFVAAFPAGGPSDIVTRALAKRMSEVLGQPVVVENRAGAGGNIGAEFVAKSAPDGYTVLLGGSYVTIAPSLYLKLGFDPLRDFTPIALLVTNQYVLSVHPSVPVRSVKELVRLAQTRPGKLNYGSAGMGSPPHLAAELFRTMAGLNIVHVPYKGASPALVDLIGGHIDFYFGGISGVLPHAKSGKVRVLAVTSVRRSAQLPETPTVSEAALPGYDITTWFGILGPAGIPREIVNRLSSAVISMVDEPELKAYLLAQGVEPHTAGPDQFAAHLKIEVSKFARIVKAAGIRPE